MNSGYNPQKIEPKWQMVWEEGAVDAARQTAERPKLYCLNYFPYPSGEGLHVGHCRNYIPTDVIARTARRRGYNVLHPMGWDAFGEPTEQHAIRTGVHPRLTTDRNTANFKRQMKMLGLSYDWSREIDSSDPAYYRWTQWFFLLLYNRGLAYRATHWQWWCPTCQTTLSSHEAAGGVCWRGHEGVTRREMPAWYFRITAYVEQLLAGLDEIDWPDNIKTMQRNWIGRSEGFEVDFLTADGQAIPAFTTRPDTLPGVTFFALAPEHPLIPALTTPDQQAEVEAYIAAALRQSEIERTSEASEKSGVFTGSSVRNPLNDEPVPVWVASYVLPSYGTGALMGVPAHDSRDFAFARQHNLPLHPVVAPAGQVEQPLSAAYEGDGVMVNAGPFSGLSNRQAGARISAQLEARGLGRSRVQYRMRDWLISRQRYWGAPIPIIHCPACGEVPVPEDQLPVLLPPMEDFQPDASGRSPLARVPEFIHTTCPQCGAAAERETDTMGGFACSSWYFLRFTSPHEQERPFDPQAAAYWMPVDLYVGGAEHAVLHLLYARFWTHVLADAGLVPFREPFRRLVNQGILHAPDGQRMSKSRRNVITPDEVVAQYGADALRVYELFMAPFEQDVVWTTRGINGARRFLQRVWSLVQATYAASAHASGSDDELERATHRTIRQVSERIDNLRFNTMISALMEFVNLLHARQRAGNWHNASFHRALDTLLHLLAPAAPHITEELWHATGHEDSIHQQPWPTWDPELAAEDQVEIAIQVDGRLRQVIESSTETDKAQLEARVLQDPQVQKFIAGRTIVRTVHVPGRVFNIVTAGRDEQNEDV